MHYLTSVTIEQGWKISPACVSRIARHATSCALSTTSPKLFQKTRVCRPSRSSIVNITIRNINNICSVRSNWSSKKKSIRKEEIQMTSIPSSYNKEMRKGYRKNRKWLSNTCSIWFSCYYEAQDFTRKWSTYKWLTCRILICESCIERSVKKQITKGNFRRK